MLIIYGIEEKSDKQVIVEIHDHLIKKRDYHKAIIFQKMTNTHKPKRYELIEWVQSVETVEFRSDSAKCVYCDEDISDSKGVFCRNHCEELEELDFEYEEKMRA